MVEPRTRHTVCIRQFVDNLHLHRRQVQIHVIHLGRGDLSRPELKEELARKFDVLDTQTLFISSFQTKAPFSKGFGIIYDSVDDALQCEPKHRLAKKVLKLMLTRLPRRVKIDNKKNHGIKTTKKIESLSEDMLEDDECFQHSSLLQIFLHIELNHILLVLYDRVYISKLLVVMKYISLIYIV